MCVTESGQPICGNGLVEPGEECDCGYSDQCKDECCYDANQPDNRKCKLKPNKVCRYSTPCSVCFSSGIPVRSLFSVEVFTGPLGSENVKCNGLLHYPGYELVRGSCVTTSQRLKIILNHKVNKAMHSVVLSESASLLSSCAMITINIHRAR